MEPAFYSFNPEACCPQVDAKMTFIQHAINNIQQLILTIITNEGRQQGIIDSDNFHIDKMDEGYVEIDGQKGKYQTYGSSGEDIVKVCYMNNDIIIKVLIGEQWEVSLID